MTADWTPMRWPAAWKDPSTLDLLKGTAVNHLVIEKSDTFAPVVARAQRQGFRVTEPGSPPGGVTVIKGQWPGVKMTASGMPDRVTAGPTGAPWVDSNGWKIRLAAAQQPGTSIWVDAVPQGPRLFAESYLMGIADAAAHWGRWIISLDEQLAAEIAGRRPGALATWKKLGDAAGFFAAQKDWSDYLPEAVVGVISDFAGGNEFLSHEVLNLVARTNQQYRIILKNSVPESSFSGLKAVLYTDDEPPAAELKKQILAFVRAGGMLITGPKWGEPPGAHAPSEEHPRYDLRALGKGRLAVAKTDFEDPYLLANDSVVLVSHRHELLRFWNGGAVGSCLAMRPDRKRAVAHMLFYAGAYFGVPTVRVAGRYRKAELRTLDQPVPRSVEVEFQQDAVEMHLPKISQYAAVDLEVQQ